MVRTGKINTDSIYKETKQLAKILDIRRIIKM